MISNPNLPPASRGGPPSGTSVEAKLYPRLPVERNWGGGRPEGNKVSEFVQVSLNVRE